MSMFVRVDVAGLLDSSVNTSSGKTPSTAVWMQKSRAGDDIKSFNLDDDVKSFNLDVEWLRRIQSLLDEKRLYRDSKWAFCMIDVSASHESIDIRIEMALYKMSSLTSLTAKIQRFALTWNSSSSSVSSTVTTNQSRDFEKKNKLHRLVPGKAKNLG